MNMKRIYHIALWAWISVLALAFGWHFSLTFLINMPLNPLQITLSPLFSMVFVPLFEQNWRFFAPDPINTNWVLLVKCKTHNSTGEHAAQETEWVDISESYLKHHQQSRGLSPRSRPLKMIKNAMLVYLGDINLGFIRKRVCRDQKRADEPFCRGEDQITKTRRAKAENLIARLASSSCDWIIGPRKADAVRAKIAIHRFPRFSERYLPDSEGTVVYKDLDWMPYQQVVAIK